MTAASKLTVMACIIACDAVQLSQQAGLTVSQCQAVQQAMHRLRCEAWCGALRLLLASWSLL